MCNCHQIHSSNGFDGRNKIAVIYHSTNETRMHLLSALEYKDGMRTMFNCSYTQKRCLARSFSAVPHGQRVWLSYKLALLHRGFLFCLVVFSPHPLCCLFPSTISIHSYLCGECCHIFFLSFSNPHITSVILNAGQTKEWFALSLPLSLSAVTVVSGNLLLHPPPHSPWLKNRST